MQIVRRAMLALSMIALILCSWFGPLDLPAVEQVDAGMKRALISFATARALNAVISVAQGTQASGQPLGVGVTFAPGQVLDPINDLVEQFSKLMLVASVVFGIQTILIGMGGYWPLSLVLTVAALGWTLFYFRTQTPPPWLSRILVILLMLRFAIPVVTLASDQLWQKYLADDYETSQLVIDTASGQVAALTPSVPVAVENLGVLEKMKSFLSKNADIKLHFEHLKQAAEHATENIIKLIVVFMLQTLVIPLLLLWALYGVARRAFELPLTGTRPSIPSH